MHALSRFRHLPYEQDRVAAALASAIENRQGRYLVLVALDRRQALVGCLIATFQRHIFSERLTASVLHFAVLPERRTGGHAVRLLLAFERCAQRRQVAEIAFGINSGTDVSRTGRFAQKMGFSRVGENFVKVLG